MEATPTLTDVLRRQLAPPLAMLREAIEACPPEAWTCADDGVAFWQHAYHALIGVPFWMREDMSQPFDFPAFDNPAAGRLEPGASPVIDRATILAFLTQTEQGVDSVFETMTDERLLDTTTFGDQPSTWADRILSQVRHVQHHTAIMKSMLRRHAGVSTPWRGFGE